MEDQLTNAKISVCYYDSDDELRIRGLKGEVAQEEEQDKPSYHNPAREHGSRGNTKNHSTNKATYERAQNQPWGMLFSWPQTSTFPFSAIAAHQCPPWVPQTHISSSGPAALGSTLGRQHHTAQEKALLESKPADSHPQATKNPGRSGNNQLHILKKQNFKTLTNQKK